MKNSSEEKTLLKKSWQTLSTPFWMFMIFTIIHGIYHGYFLNQMETMRYGQSLNMMENTAFYVLVALCIWWLLIRLCNTLFELFERSALLQDNKIFLIIFPFFTVASKLILSLLAFNILAQHLDLPEYMAFYIHKISSILIILAISALLFKLTSISEALLMHQYNARMNGDNTERKIYTQTLLMKRIAYMIITIITVGAISLLFESGRILGTSVLTTAGFLGLVITFTAQRSLGSLFSGLEIVISQSIKMGDAVIVDGEAGIIEEINFRHVVVKLWDWRRLIVPTSYFLDKSFHNLSKKQKNNVIGAVDFYADFTLPVCKVRKKLQDIVKQSSSWDQNVCQLQVEDLQERSMKIRVLASARNTDEVMNLCAEIREKIIGYIVTNHSYALPKTRSFTLKQEHESAASQANELTI